MGFNPNVRGNSIFSGGVDLSSATPPAGSTGVGDDNSYVNITPADPTVKGALEALDAAVTGGGGSAAGPAGAIQLSDGAGNFTAEAGIAAGGGAMYVTGGSSQNSFRSFSSASVNELFFGRGASAGECFVITHWPDAGPYTDLHMFGLSSNHLVLDANGRVGIGLSAPANPLHVYSAAEPPDGGLIALFETGDGNNYLEVRAGTARFIQGSDRDTLGFFGMLSGHPLSVRTSNVERIRVGEDGRVQIGTFFSTGDGSVLILNGGSNSNILTVRAAAGGSEGAFSMGSLATGAGFIQATDSALSTVAPLRLNHQGGDLILGLALLVWPSVDGSPGQVLSTNGSAALSWIDPVSPNLVKIRKTTNSGQSLVNTGGNNQIIVFEDDTGAFGEYDNSGGAYDTGTGEFTAPNDGYYAIHSTVTIDHTAESGVFMIDIVVNGTEVNRGQRLNVLAGGTTGAHVSDILFLAANDVLSVRVRNETSGTVELEAYNPSNFIVINELP